MTKAILFDLDGTLADTALDFFEILKNATNTIRKTPFSYAEFRPLAGQGADAMICHSYEIDKNHAHFAVYKKQFLDDYKRLAGTHAVLFPGIWDMLHELDMQSIPWGIVTDKPRHFTLALLAKWQLNVSVLVCSDDPEIGEHFRKPHPKSLQLACEQMKGDLLQEEIECAYVGDSIKDIQAGHAAQMQTIAVGYGYTLENTLLHSEFQAHFFVSSPQTLKECIRQWLEPNPDLTGCFIPKRI